MAQNIKLKRSSVAGKVPSTAQLEAGEIAINTADGKLYFERDDSTIQTIVTTNAVITGSLNINGPITGSDVQIDQWGSISASLSAISTGTATQNLQNVTDNGSTTTNAITAPSFTGSLSGTASYASFAATAATASTSDFVNILSTSLPNTYYVTFNGGTGRQTQLLNGTMEYRANTDTLIVTNISGADSVTSLDVSIDGWGSVSASLSAIQSGANTVTLQDVTDNGNTTTNSITAASFTGSLFGTASYATQALTASYSLTATSSSHALNANNALTASYVASASYTPTLQQVTNAGNSTTNDIILSGSLVFGLPDNNISIGKDSLLGSAMVQNIAIGTNALKSGSNNGINIAIGHSALASGSAPGTNLAIGNSALFYYGLSNATALGHDSLTYALVAGGATGVGRRALGGAVNAYGTTAVGYEAGYGNSGVDVTTFASASVYLGYRAEPFNSQSINEIVIGASVTGKGNNTVTIGNASITDNYFSGNISGSDVNIDNWGSVSASLASIGNNTVSSSYALSASYAETADLATTAINTSYAQNVVVTGKNLSGGTITKGTPLYFTGSGTSGNTVGIYPADAGNPARMPAGGIAGESITDGSEGLVLINGYIDGVATSAFTPGAQVFVAVGGGYTDIPPTGSALVQKLGNVEKSHPSAGSGVINGPGAVRSVPNIASGFTWVGAANGVATPTAVSSLSVASAVSASYAATASYLNPLNQALQITGDLTTSGSITTIGNVTITGSLNILGSTTFTSVTSSTLVVDSNIIYVNAAAGVGSQFAGLGIVDTEDINSTASFLWDSINHYWIESVPTHELGYSSSLFVLGPESSGSVGSEIQLGENKITVARGGHHLYDSNITDTGTLVSVNSNTEITGSLNVSQQASFASGVTVVGNLQVFGTSSFTYVTSSQLNVDNSFISVNVFEPAERFGGLKVYDSGSSTATASLAWDSLHNHWVYQNASGSTYSGGMFIAGPRNTGSLGDEPTLTKWMVTRGDGGDHVNDTQIYSSGSVTKITGSLTTSGKVYIETVDNYGSDPDKFLSIVNNEVVYRTGAQLLSDIGGQTAGTFVQNAGSGGTARYIMRYEDSNSATTSSIYETATGNIGIRKTTAGAALDVNGSAIVTGSLNVSGIGYLASVTSSGDIQVNGVTVGRGTGNSNTNILLGSGSLGSLTTGTHNIVVGVGSNVSSTTSQRNAFVGNQVFTAGSSAQRSVGMGYQAMYNSSAANIFESVAIGYQSQYVGGGIGNVAVGAGTMVGGSATNDVGNYNTAVGTYSMGNAPGVGNENVGIGTDTLFSLVSGSRNVAVGNQALAGNTNQSNNIAIGYRTLYRTGESNSNGGSNIGIGDQAGTNMYSGSNNIFIGTNAGAQFNTVINNVVIGGFNGSASPLASQNGNMILATGNGTIRMFVTGSNGNIALGGHTNPQYKVDISGSLGIRGTATVVQEGIQVSGTSTLTVASISTTSYDGAFLDYLIVSGSNRRAGTLTTVWTASDIEWKDTSTMDLGSTNGAEFTPAINGSNADLVLAVPAGTWTVKGHLRYM